MKKDFTSFDVTAAVRELGEKATGSRVSNVYQLDAKTLLLKLHKTDKPALHLIMEAGRRLHLTAYEMEKPSVPPAFCMALRKYLRDSWLASVEQHEFERVIVFSFKTKAGVLKLILELFGDGNLILVDERNLILQALVYRRMRDRNILRNEAFKFAPSSGRNPLKISAKEFLELRNLGNVEVVRALVRLVSIGGVYAEEVLQRAGIDKKKPCNALSDAEVEALFENMEGLLRQVTSGALEPCIMSDRTGAYVDVLPIKLQQYEECVCKPFESFNEALDEFYASLTAIQKATRGENLEELRREADRLRRIIENQEKQLIETKARVEQDKQIGDSIYAHAAELQILMDELKAHRQEGKDWRQISSEISAERQALQAPNVLLESFNAENLIMNVRVGDLRFDLDLHETLFTNASRLYESSKRFKQKLEGAKTALAETQKHLTEIEAQILEAEVSKRQAPAEAIEELAKRRMRRKQWFEKFRWFRSSDSFLVVAGKDSVTNEVLIKKHTDPTDIVFHADIVGAPFVVIKAEGKSPTEQALKEAGEFAAATSRAWREGFGSVDVYWVKPEQLSKVGPSGEYVSHGAFAVIGKRNWFRGVPLRVAVGVKFENDGMIFLGGALDAVRKKTETYVIIIPGDDSRKNFFRKVLGVLAKKTPKNQRERVQKAPIESIREFIPYGKGRVMEN
jgi:predicted ribosome quality control (RQC) complex YloA/Tae2 family protein